MIINCSVCGTCGSTALCGSEGLWGLLSVISGLLLFSLCWNILLCVQKCYAEKGRKFLPRFRRSVSLKHRQMEENPIYGNITYSKSDNNKEEAPPHKLFSTERDCYANVSLKVPKASTSGRGSPLPQIQYTDVMVICEEVEEVEEEEEGGEDRNYMEKDTCSVLSELYASVDAEHIKNKKQPSEEPYANHIDL